MVDSYTHKTAIFLLTKVLFKHRMRSRLRLFTVLDLNLTNLNLTSAMFT